MVFVTWLTVCRQTIAARSSAQTKELLNQAGGLVRLWQRNAIVSLWCRVFDDYVVAVAKALWLHQRATVATSDSLPDMVSSSSGGDADEGAESSSTEDESSTISEEDPMNMEDQMDTILVARIMQLRGLEL